MVAVTDPALSVAALKTRGVAGLSIPRCTQCGSETRRTWAELGARDDEDMIAVADGALTCVACGKPHHGSDVIGFMVEPQVPEL